MVTRCKGSHCCGCCWDVYSRKGLGHKLTFGITNRMNNKGVIDVNYDLQAWEFPYNISMVCKHRQGNVINSIPATRLHHLTIEE